MICSEALRLLEFARPGSTELDGADVAALEQHLASCPACAAFARHEIAADDLVARALYTIEPPPGSRERLLARLAALRRGWWLRMGAVAGGLLLAGTAGWWFYPAPLFDPEAISYLDQEQIGNRDAADEWLRQQDSRFGVPSKLRMRYLVSFERQTFHGVQAPVLTFARGNSVARVAVLTTGQFRNLSSLVPGLLAENSATALHLIRDPDRPGVFYMVEVLNGRVEPFLHEDDGSAT